MKKVYVLLSAACVAVSASAVEKEMASANVQLSDAKLVKETVAPRANASRVEASSAMKKAKGTRAVGEYTYFRPADNVMAIGTSENGYGYNVTFGFASSYGNLVFNNYSTGASSMQWTYTNLNDFEGSGTDAVWNYSTSSSVDLAIKSGIGEIMPVELTSTFSNGTTDTYSIGNMAEYVCGGGATYWGFSDELGGDFGVTFYQNPGLSNPQGYRGFLTYKNSYEPGGEGYNEAGVYVDPDSRNNWQSVIDNRVGSPVTDLALENFTFIQPEPASTYFITRAWISMNITASADTQLLSYIYPLTEEGFISDTPIALGYASVSKGEGYDAIFYYYPLDEEGNELEGEVFIDSSVAITVEGFAGNPAITSIQLACGYYPFSYEQYSDGNYGLCRDADMYLSFSYKVDGQTETLLAYDNGLYYFDSSYKDQDTLTLGAYGKVTMDAVFPYIMEENGVDTVYIPVEGGSATVELTALYYNIPALVEDGTYVVSAPEWIDVKFGALDKENAVTPMTVSVEAGGDRTGVVTIEGIGATYKLYVNQGQGDAVSTIVVDKDAQYFDLQGRRVANPEKGIFIKKSGNKAEKVIL